MTEIELRDLLNEMSLEEKIGQLVQLNADFYNDEHKAYMIGPGSSLGLSHEQVQNAGSILGSYGAEFLKKIQKKYMEEHPHHIPLLFMQDVIYGMKTIFPIPLALGCSFDPEMVKSCMEVTAKEAAVTGLHVTFSPMADLVRDARWGRVMESTGEDPYLNARMTKAFVEGFQGEKIGEKDHLCACVKHFAAYGAPVAGREYNNVELSETTFYNEYIGAYQAGIDAGAGMVMTSFNTLNGVPASINKELMRNLLREKMGFEGVLISDYSAIRETIAHGCSADEKEAARKALEAGVDIDMMTNVYASYLKEQIEDGTVSKELLDESVFRILKLKNDLGLFENPYKDADEKREQNEILCEEHRALARKMAASSMVLLKNDGILPLPVSKKEKKIEKIAWIGPYISHKETLGNWAVNGEFKDTVALQEAVMELDSDLEFTFAEGTSILDQDTTAPGFATTAQEKEKFYLEEKCKQLLKEAVQIAEKADFVVMAIGEHYMQSGESASRAMIDLPERQMELFDEVYRVNQNIVVVLYNGRPLDLRRINKRARAILEVWFPGTEGGHAITDVLMGNVNPSGKLSMSIPYSVGQVPISYNEYRTGRPSSLAKGITDPEDVNRRFVSKYIDIPNEPLYPFGYGLTYTTFEFSETKLNQNILRQDGAILCSTVLKNTGSREGTQTVQLYLQDVSASIARPIRALKDFKKITLQPGESQSVQFEITEKMLRFINEQGEELSESGEFKVWISDSSDVKEDGKSFQLMLS